MKQPDVSSPLEFFFLKSPISEPYSVSIWIILNDIKFRIGFFQFSDTFTR